MACLENLDGGHRISLGDEMVVGRASRSTLQLDDPRVSGQHALLRWRDERWWVRDLGSSNGTTVNNATLEPGRQVVLARHALVNFGGEQRWRLIDDGPPMVAAHHAGRNETVRASDGFLGIPDPEAPEATLHRDESGCWILEHVDDIRAVNDQEQLTLSDGSWQLWLPQHGEAIDTTRTSSGAPRVLRLMTLRFRVSRDEEYIELDLLSGSETLSLGTRSHHDMLLALARVRLEDINNADVGHAEHGWIYTDELCRMLRCEPDQLNILVFRARKQLSQAGVDNAGEIIQRRPSNRQLRLGTERVRIDTL